MKKIIIAVVILAVVVVGWFLLQKSETVPPPDLPRPLGALTGPDIPFDYLCTGGVCNYYRHVSLRTAGGTTGGTFVPCSMRAPGATSTLVRATASFLDATTTVRQVVFGKGNNGASGISNNTATTTLIGEAVEIPSYLTTTATTSTIVASTTASQLANNVLVFKANEWLNVGVKPLDGVHAGGLFGDVDCNAVFQTTN